MFKLLSLTKQIQVINLRTRKAKFIKVWFYCHQLMWFIICFTVNDQQQVMSE